MWTSNIKPCITHANLMSLRDNTIPAIIVEQFLTPGVCNSITANINIDNDFDYYRSPPTGIIGSSLHAHRQRQVTYFESSEAANKRVAQCFAGTINPTDKLMSSLVSDGEISVNIAREKDERQYAAAAIRLVNGGASAHADFAPLEDATTDLSIGEITHQLSFNIYLTEIDTGGELVIFDRHVDEDNRHFDQLGSQTYDIDCSSTQSVVIKPKIGMLVIFNSRNFHLISPTTSNRISLQAFLGMKTPNKAMMWT